jgi:predicted MFS family arabinose efflux permease
MSSTADVITRTAPPERRGRALGLHTSALTLGNAAGAPLIGLAVDRWSPASGFVTIGILGAGLALGAMVVTHLLRRRRTAPDGGRGRLEIRSGSRSGPASRQRRIPNRG